MRLMGAPHGIVILQGWRFRPCLSWIPSKYGKTCMASSSGNESMHFWCYLVLIFLHRDAVAAARRSVSSSSEMRRWTATGTIFLQHAVTEGLVFTLASHPHSRPHMQRRSSFVVGHLKDSESTIHQCLQNLLFSFNLSPCHLSFRPPLSSHSLLAVSSHLHVDILHLQQRGSVC